MQSLPFSQSCENNKDAIAEVLSRVFASRREVLEIASGTGQHAAWFSERLAHLQWQATELASHLEVLKPRCQQYLGDNLLPPKALDVSDRPWPVESIPHALFTANSLHIMPWNSVEALFAELGERAGADTLLAVYGPFNYGGEYTSPSNASFDQWLAQRSSESAIRDFEKVDALAQLAGFGLLEDVAMPANNRLLVWLKR
ncbi:MAG: DUF938 domain-containing protein [Halioglobus sp.]